MRRWGFAAALAAPHLAAALLAPSLAAAEPRKLLVLQSEGRADAAVRAKIDAAITRLAAAAEPGTSPGEVTFSDAAAAAGCRPDAASCKNDVIGMLSVDEIVITRVTPKPGGLEIAVQRISRGGTARDATMLLPTGASADRLDGIAPLFRDRLAGGSPRPAGSSGTAGSSANPGSSGAAGSSSNPRFSGTADSSANPGSSGAAGSSAKPGSSGAAGSSGNPGSSGAAGSSGNPGSASAGNAGSIGATATTPSITQPGAQSDAQPGEPGPAIPPPSAIAPPPRPIPVTSPEPAAPPDPSSLRDHKLELGGMIGGGGAVVLGLLFWNAASSTQHDIDVSPTRTQKDLADLRDLESRGDVYAAAGNVLVVTGAIVGGLATYLYIRDRGAASTIATARLTPAVMPHGAGVVLSFGGPP